MSTRRNRLLLLALVATPLFAEDTERAYLCITDQSVGFLYSELEKEWQMTRFKVDDSKYLVRPVKPEERENDIFLTKAVYAIWRVGEDSPVAWCSEGFNDAEWLNCAGLLQEFRMNAVSKRFDLISPGGYSSATLHGERIDGELTISTKPDEGGDSPFVDIGKCSEL